MTVSPAPTNATDLASTAKNLRAYYLDQFNQAFAKANVAPPPPLPANATTEQKEAAKNAAAELAKAQSQLQQSFQQIADVDRKATGVALLSTIEDTAARVKARIKAIVPETSNSSTSMSQAHINELVALDGVLEALAVLAPASLWEGGSGSGGQ